MTTSGIAIVVFTSTIVQRLSSVAGRSLFKIYHQICSVNLFRYKVKKIDKKWQHYGTFQTTFKN